jgi:hypothetical protein
MPGAGNFEEGVIRMKFVKKFSWKIGFLAALVSFCCFAAFAAEEKYVLEKETVYRVKSDGKRQKIEDAGIMAFGIEGGAKGGIFWFAVDPEANESMKGSKGGIYFFDDKDKFLWFLPYDDAATVSNILFSPDGKQMVLDAGTWVIRDYILHNFKETEEKASFTGTSEPIWIDAHRFAFTMVESDAEPRPSATDFDGWTSVVVYDTAAKEIVQVTKATETKNYALTEVDWDKEELRITETSVKNKADWADMEKQEDRELTVPFPPAG